MKEWRVLSSEKVYSCGIFDIIKEQYRSPEGVEGDYSFLDCMDGMCVLPITRDNNVVLVRQYRQALKRELLEIPAGAMDKDEKPEETAARELKEETGYKAEGIKHLGSFDIAPGKMSQQIQILAAFNCEKIKERQEDADDSYFIRDVLEMPFGEFEKQVKEQKIKDSLTISALFYFKSYLELKKI